MADVQIKKHEIEWVNQPCGESGIFTTTGVGRIKRQDANAPAMDERLDAFDKAKDQATFWARMICATNPACPIAQFIKYVNIEEDCVNEHLVVKLTIQWCCKEESNLPN